MKPKLQIKFHTFLFTPDEGRSRIFEMLVDKIAGNHIVISQEDHYDGGVFVDVDTRVGFWATDDEYADILANWDEHCLNRAERLPE